MFMNRRTFLAAGASASVAAVAVGQGAPRKYRACIIGDLKNGAYGHSMHLAFALRDDVEVVALADPSEEGRTRAGKEAGAARTYADYREMLEKEKPDLVAVGPRTTVNHRDYVLACADVGAHGYLEKPLAVDLAEADAMVAAVKAKNLKWALAYNVRMTPIMAHVKKMMWDEKLIGSIYEIRGRGKEDHRAGAEDLIVLGTHIFDLMAYLMGPPSWCQADITHNGKPARPENVREATEPLGPIVGNRLHALYGFAKGKAGHFSSMYSRDGGGGRWGVTIHGGKGVIQVHMGVVPEAWWLDDSRWTAAHGTPWKPLPGMPDFTVADERRERHKYIVDDLIASIEADREPQTSLARSVMAQEMIQGVFASHVNGRRITIPQAEREHPLKDWA